MKTQIDVFLAALLLACGFIPAPAQAQCLEWSNGFQMAGPSDGVHALLAVSAGPLTGLYAGGEFTTAGGVAADNIARWDGATWSALGSGVSGGRVPRISALTTFGGQLIVAGAFTTAGAVSASNIARWDGSAWTPLGLGVDGAVLALAVYDNGSGPALYAGGVFEKAGGAPAPFLARWNGSLWSPIPGAPAGPIAALAAVPAGFTGGAALFAGGIFSNAGLVSASNVARLSGSTWSSLGLGTDDTVQSLALFDDGLGGGSALYVGGGFRAAGGGAANPVARWNGVAWSNVGTAVAAETKFDNVRTLLAHGGVLYAGGRFASAGGVSASGIARWTGSSWQPVAGGADGTVRALAVFDSAPIDACGPSLYVGGHFTTAGGGVAQHVAKLCGASWTSVASGNGVSHTVEALVPHAGQLYAGGSFLTAGNVPANRIARWNGTSWSALASGLNGAVHALAVFDDGSGAAVYAGGSFTLAGALHVNHIAKWDGVNFVPLVFGFTGPVYSLAVFDDGSGSALYAGGDFAAPATSAVLSSPALPPLGTSPHIAKWNGSAWSTVGGGTNGIVRALAVQGAALFAGGDFTTAGAHNASHIARWNGTTWNGVQNGLDGVVNALTAFNAQLIVGGEFDAAGVVPTRRIASWNGVNWSQVGQGFDDDVRALAVFNDGSGAALYAGGDFANSGLSPVKHIARFNGIGFTPLAGGTNDAVRALAVYDDGLGGGLDLYLGGEFTVSGNKSASRIARWLGCP